MFLFCLVYLLLECGDAVGDQSFLTKKTLYDRNCGFAVFGCAMCVEKRSKTLIDAADVEDWMTGFVSNT